MTVNDWITFILASTVIIISPGPSVIYVTTNSMTNEIKTMMPLIIGLTAGYFCGMGISLIFISSLLKISSYSLVVLKIIGSGYLTYLAIQMWTRKQINQDSRKPTFIRGVLIAISNPKAQLFYTTFFPQFGHTQVDMVYLALCYGILSFIVDFSNMLISHFVSRGISMNSLMWINRSGALLLWLTTLKIWL